MSGSKKNQPKGWYNTVLKIDKQLDERKNGKDFHSLDALIQEQVKGLIQQFEDCRFVGFNADDPEAEKIISDLMVKVQSQVSEKMNDVPEHPFFNLYLGLCYLERVLTLIKSEYERNLSLSLTHLENIIYQSKDYKNLVEVSRNIGRKIINGKQHPDFAVLKQHINEQLNYIEANSKILKVMPEKKFEINTQDSFHFFDLYFQAHSALMMYKKHYLYQYKGATVEYFTAVNEKEIATNIKEIAANFTKEIRNNVLRFGSINKIKKYLEQIQTKLNSVYESLELDRKTPVLESFGYDSSIPSIQNLIRDIAIKNGIEILGDETGLTKADAKKEKKASLDFTKVFPTAEQFTEYDLRPNVEAAFGGLMRQFIGMKAKTVNVPALLEKELKRLEDWRDNTAPPETTYCDNTINMFPFFARGWAMPISGDYTGTNNEFKFIDEIKDQISEKYRGKVLPPQYFEKLSKVATEEVIKGAAHSKYYYWLKEQANSGLSETKEDTDEEINWMKIFKDLDIDKPIKPQAYKTTTLSDKKVYFSKASMNLTKQYMLKFKKETHLLNKDSMLAYIDALNLKKPAIGNSEGPEFNQVVFQADKNFFDFIQVYKRNLQFMKTTEEIRLENEANKSNLYDRLSAVAYFSPMEGDGTKIPMFTTSTNDAFRDIVRDELAQIRKAEAEGNKTAPNPYRSRDMMYLERVRETEHQVLIALFHEKFAEAKHYGFKTKEWFARKQLEEVATMKAAGWFPIFEQWSELLKRIAETGDVPQAPKSKAVIKPKSMAKANSKPDTANFSLKQIAIAYFVLGIPINKDNAPDILKKYSQATSVSKLLQKRISKSSEITNITENKTADTKHQKDLQEAKRLLSGIKTKKSKTDIDRYIKAFESNYKAHY